MLSCSKRLALTPAALVASLSGTALGQSTVPFPAQFQLSSLLPAFGGDGSNGFVLNGVEAFNLTGVSVSSTGDVNGDGFDDLIVGAMFADVGGTMYAGSSFVVFGGPGVASGGERELSALNGANGFRIDGISLNDQSGRSVSGAGDVNGDGIDDLIIGAFYGDPSGVYNAGESYVVFGALGVGAGGALDLASLNGANGFVINGIDPSDYSGGRVSSAGDVNGDGFADVMVSATGASPGGRTRAGETYVVFGGAIVGASGSVDLSGLNGASGFQLNGIAMDDRSGYALSGAGDVNGDGVDDLIVSAYAASPNAITGAGEAYVLFGGPGVGSTGSIDLASLLGQSGFSIPGVNAYDYAGQAVGLAGDVNGDGIDDLMVGAGQAEYNGQAYLVFGGPGVGAAGTVPPATLDGSDGFVMNGVNAGDGFGISVSGAGDVNGDGIADMIVGALNADPGGVSGAGASYIVFGGMGVGAGGTLNLSELNGTNSFALNGIDSYDYSGVSVSGAGDVNGDGIDDVIIGAFSASPGGLGAAGEAYVVFGRANANIWTSAAGGNWDFPGNWQGGRAPIAGHTRIEPEIGVTVSGPAGVASLSSLVLSAAVGRTTLDLRPSSLMTVDNSFLVPGSAALIGAGTFSAIDVITNDGLISLEGMSLLAPAGLTIGSGGVLESTSGFVDGDVNSSGRIDLSGLGKPQGFLDLEIVGALTNAPGAEILLRSADIMFGASGGIDNTGSLDVVFATATIFGAVSNSAMSSRVSVTGSSDAIFADDVLNSGEMLLSDDSTIIILGSLTGSGITGQGGGATAGTVFIAGGIQPGVALGAASFGGNINLGGSARTVLEIGGTTPGVDLDQIATLANLGVGGVLEIGVVGEFVPSPGDLYDVLDFASITGSFRSIILDQALIDAGADTSKLLTDGIIEIPVPCQGDADGNGSVNFADITSVLIHWLTDYSPGTGEGDADTNGIVNFADITAVLINWLDECP